MIGFMFGVIFGLGFHYAVCKYSGCVTGCECKKWKGLR
jgi:hypothetical protein